MCACRDEAVEGGVGRVVDHRPFQLPSRAGGRARAQGRERESARARETGITTTNTAVKYAAAAEMRRGGGRCGNVGNNDRLSRHSCRVEG